MLYVHLQYHVYINVLQNYKTKMKQQKTSQPPAHQSRTTLSSQTKKISAKISISDFEIVGLDDILQEESLLILRNLVYLC